MSDQVGFAFQADVVNTASLTHMLTGQVLKALGDGGVDAYAMFAAFWLGGKVPVRTSPSETIHSQIIQKSRISIQSVLAKVLSIGWGHSTPVIEMTRTQAGTNALLVIGALATGSTTFQAAQLLHEILSVYGLDPQNLPNIDVLRGLISYLAPFSHDMGFSKVLHHIAVTVEKAVRTSNTYATKPPHAQEDGLWKLKSLGNASVVAGDIKQVVFTAQRKESHYMVLRARGAWLPAFASHILGMSVEMRLDEEILWACGGDRGNIIFQLGHHPINDLGLQSTHRPLTIVSSDIAPLQEGSSIEYPLSQVVASHLTKWPEVNQDLADLIHQAINKLADANASLLHELSFSHTTNPHDRENVFFTQHHFDNQEALRETLDAMRINPRLPVKKSAFEYRNIDRSGYSLWQHGLSAMTRDDLHELVTRHCVVHSSTLNSWIQLMSDQNAEDTPRCLCKRIGMLIGGAAAASVALARCKFDSSQIMLQESVLLGETPTAWSQKLFRSYVTKKNYPRNDELFDYLGRLICHDYTDAWLASYHAATKGGQKPFVLGLSGGAFTIYYSCIMHKDCYDRLGRMIEIRVGRASVAGMFRHVMVDWRTQDSQFDAQMEGLRDNLEPSILAGGAHLGPHLRPSQTQLHIDAVVDETTFSLQLRLQTPFSRPVYLPLTIFITKFMNRWDVPRCEDDKSALYETQHDKEVAVDGFSGSYRWVNEKELPAEVLVFALQGDKFQQILMCGLLAWASQDDSPKKQVILQLNACLKCCIRLAKLSTHTNKLPFVVMGG